MRIVLLSALFFTLLSSQSANSTENIIAYTAHASVPKSAEIFRRIWVCEALSKALHKAPSTFKRFTSQDDGRLVTINYDITNPFGVPIRHQISCDFQTSPHWPNVYMPIKMIWGTPAEKTHETNSTAAAKLAPLVAKSAIHWLQSHNYLEDNGTTPTAPD